MSLYSSASASNVGAILWHGPHQTAVKSEQRGGTRVGCLRSLTGVVAAGAERTDYHQLVVPASSCKASHSPSAKVRTPPRRRSSSGAAGATQLRVAVLPCWLEAGCDASCDAS